MKLSEPCLRSSPRDLEGRGATFQMGPAAIISDNHGDWTTQRFDGGVAEALPRWKALPFHYASVLFARRPVDGQWVVEKSFGMGRAVARIEERFRGEFARAMFPLHAVALPVPPPVPSAPPMLEFEGSPPPYTGAREGVHALL